MANIHSDLPNKPLKHTGMIKMLTGEDSIQIEYKYKQPFSYENRAKLIFAANEVPEAYDTTYAWYFRVVLINFPNQFIGNNMIPKKQLLEEMTTEEELSGLLNQAIKGLKRLFETNRFSNMASYEDQRQNYVKKSSPVQWFVENYIETVIDFTERKSDVYEAYVKMCRDELDRNPLPSNVFSMHFKRYCPASEGKTTIDDQTVRVWRDISLKGERMKDRFEAQDQMIDRLIQAQQGE